MKKENVIEIFKLTQKGVKKFNDSLIKMTDEQLLNHYNITNCKAKTIKKELIKRDNAKGLGRLLTNEYEFVKECATNPQVWDLLEKGTK